MKTETVKRPLTLFEKIEFFDRKLRNGNAFPADEREGQKLLAICNAAPELLEALKGLDHNAGADNNKSGYCICPLLDGKASDDKHATSCSDAREAIAKAQPFAPFPAGSEASEVRFHLAVEYAP